MAYVSLSNEATSNIADQYLTEISINQLSPKNIMME